MALQYQTISIPFTKGRETKIDPNIVDKSKLLNLQNYTFNKNGTLTRRDAITALASFALPSGGATQGELGAVNTDLFAIDASNNLHSWSPGISVAETIGQVNYCSLRKDSIFRSAASQTNVDSAFMSGVSCYVYNDSLLVGVYITLIDEITGSVIASNLQASNSSTATNPKVVAYNGKFVIIWTDTTNIASAVTDNQGNLSLNGTFVTTFDSGFYYDFISLGNFGFVAFSSNAANHTVDCITIDNTGSLVSGPTQVLTNAQVAQGAEKGVAVAAFSTSLVGVAIGDATPQLNTFTVAVNASTGAIGSVSSRNTQAIAATPVSVSSTFNTTSAIMYLVACPGPKATSINQITQCRLSSGNFTSNRSDFVASIGSVGGFEGPFAVAKPFSVGLVTYLPVQVVSPNTTNQQSTFYVLDITSIVSGHYVLARALIGTAVLNANLGRTMPNSNVLTGSFTNGFNMISVGVAEQGRVSSLSGFNTTLQGVSRVKLLFNRVSSTTDYRYTPLWHTQLGQLEYFSGANLQLYDGTQVTEAGFHYYPEGITSTLAAAGAGNLSNGQYQYTAVYEWTDTKGNRYQSDPAPVTTATVADHTTNGKVALTAPTLQLGTRATNKTSIVFYRTLVTGQTFYRLTSIANSTTVKDVSVTDNTSDTSLASNELLYSQPGTTLTPLPNDCPFPCRAITTFQNRIFIAGLEDPYQFAYSQKLVTGVGPQFSQVLTGRIPQGFGEITALYPLDDKLVIFTPTHKFVLFGQGPDNTGANSTYGDPQLLPSDTGCIDQRTIALIPDIAVPETANIRTGGLGYNSKHGYYLLTRGLTDEYIGEPVENDISGNIITAAVILENKSQLRLSLNNSTILTYDFLFNQWSKFVSNVTMEFDSACVWNNLYTAISNQAIVQDDTTGSYLDLGSSSGFITGTIRTAWIKISAIQGFYRMRRLALLGAFGAGNGNSSLTIAVDFDYSGQGSGSNSYNFNIPNVNAIGIAANMPFQIRHHIQNQQKCEAFSFVLIDVPTAANPSGCNFTGITLELATKTGINRLPSGQTF